MHKSEERRALAALGGGFYVELILFVFPIRISSVSGVSSVSSVSSASSVSSVSV